MRYIGYTIIIDPTTLETRIYLKPEGSEDSGMKDYLALDPAHADELSGSLIMRNAERKRMMVKGKGEGFVSRFRRK